VKGKSAAAITMARASRMGRRPAISTNARQIIGFSDEFNYKI
jgi:hypothetical protein